MIESHLIPHQAGHSGATPHDFLPYGLQNRENQAIEGESGDARLHVVILRRPPAPLPCGPSLLLCDLPRKVFKQF